MVDIYPGWFFNLTTSQCGLFSYSGCDGNSNRFSTLEQCTHSCDKYNMTLVIILSMVV